MTSHIFRTFRQECKENTLPCWICGESIDYEKIQSRIYWFSIDHYIPKSHGGTNGKSNLKPSHWICNHRRGNISPKNTKWIGDILTGRWNHESDKKRLSRIEKEILVRRTWTLEKNRVKINPLWNIRPNTLASSFNYPTRKGILIQESRFENGYKNNISTELI